VEKPTVTLRRPTPCGCGAPRRPRADGGHIERFTRPCALSGKLAAPRFIEAHRLLPAAQPRRGADLMIHDIDRRACGAAGAIEAAGSSC
jgi:hypothetical protein